jgi:hypothetical protein
VDFKFNDVNSTGTGLTNAYLLQLDASTVTIKNNIFLSSWTVSGSSASLYMSADSGAHSDYNDWFSSSSAHIAVWGNSYATLAGWQAAGQDANSISLHPFWYDPIAGIEDFHPLSEVGRYHPDTGLFSPVDGYSSWTIDAADPAEGYGLEPAPHGETPNQGSYGLTAQASMSPEILAIKLSTGLYDFGTVDRAVAMSTVSVSSVIATNAGNIVEHFQISATTITPGSLWVVGEQADIETVRLQGIFNSYQPNAEFDAVASTATDTARLCGPSGGRYAGDQNGNSVPVRGGRGMWLKLTAPTSTIYNGQEQIIRMTFTAIKP